MRFVALAAACALAYPVPAEARPVRSGRIVSGVFTTSPSWNCSLVPDCAAWLATGCMPLLTERDPAWLASIVNVAEIADGRRTRTFAYGPGNPAGLDPGGMTVEFWDDRCRQLVEIRTWSARDHSFDRRIELVVPRDAVWMTVTANDKLNAVWTLS